MTKLTIIFCILFFLLATGTVRAQSRGYHCPSEREVAMLKNRLNILKEHYSYQKRDCTELEEKIALMSEVDPEKSLAILNLKSCLQKADGLRDKILVNLAAQACKPIP